MLLNTGTGLRNLHPQMVRTYHANKYCCVRKVRRQQRLIGSNLKQQVQLLCAAVYRYTNNAHSTEHYRNKAQRHVHGRY